MSRAAPSSGGSLLVCGYGTTRALPIDYANEGPLLDELCAGWQKQHLLPLDRVDEESLMPIAGCVSVGLTPITALEVR